MAIAIVDTSKRLEVFTYEDYLQLPDNGKRYEIIDGELYMPPAPTTGHQRIVGRFHLAIGNFLQENPIGEVFLHQLTLFFQKSIFCNRMSFSSPKKTLNGWRAKIFKARRTW